MSRSPTIFWPALTALACFHAAVPCAAQVFRGPDPPLPPPIPHASPRVTGNPFVRTWRAEDYDGGAASFSVAQHPRTGFVYVANADGVLEFDGARWQLITLPKRSGAARLAIDARGRIWVGAANEIARIEPDANGVLSARTVVAELPGGDFSYTGEAVVAPDGIWFGGLQHVLRVGADDTVATWETAESFGNIWRMAGAVHTAVSSREIVRFDEGGRLVPVLARDTLGAAQRRPNAFTVFGARDRPDGGTCVLTALGPVMWRSGPGPTWRLMPEAFPFFRDAVAVGAAFIGEGRMVFSMVRTGLVLLAEDGSVERLIDRMPGILSEHFSHLAEDDEGGLWAPGSEHIVRFDLRRRFSRHDGLQVLQGRPRQLLRHDGTLYVAHSEGVSHRIEWPGYFPPVAGAMRGAEALAVANGRVFAASVGLLEVAADARPRIWSSRGIKTLAATRTEPAALLAGDTQGLLVFEPLGTGWTESARVAALRGSVEAIFDAGEGGVWAATSDGRLWRVDFRAGRQATAPVRTFGVEQGVPPRAPAERIKFFALGDTLMATCSSWLLRFDAAAERFVSETRIAGLEGTATLGAEAVATNNDENACWLRLGAPDRRLVRIVPDGPGRWRALELSAPILREFPVISLYEDQAQRTLWIAGTDSLVSVDLDWRPAPPSLSLVAHIRRVVAGADDTVWTESAVRAPLALARQQTALRFEFAAPVFGADHRGRALVQYRTWLEGFEPHWTAWSGEPRRDFTNLPYRALTFRVQARDQSGRVSEETTLRFAIAAPWWLTRTALAGGTAFAALTVLGLVKLRTRSLHRRATRLEAVIAARTAELAEKNAALVAQNEELARLRELDRDEKVAARLAEEKARLEVLRYQLNPHFLYNALNSIYGLVLTTPRNAAAMVLRLADFCRAALTRREEELTTVGAEFDKLSLYLDIEKVRWNDSLQIEFDVDEAARARCVPPFLLQPLVENAIKYGGSTSPDALRVRLSAKMAETDGALLLEVANSGSWIEPADARTRGNTGLGLANLRQRLDRSCAGAFELTTGVNDGWVVVRLKLAASVTDPSRAPARVSSTAPFET